MKTEKQKLHNLYWNQDMTLQEIADYLGWSWSKIYYRFREKHNIPTHRILWRELNFDDKELRKQLSTKYSSMKHRVNGESDREQYTGLALLSQKEFIELCNENKDRILTIWRKYLNSNRDLRYALSVDRIDNSSGYTKDNVQFVCNGFNSWKNEINPIKVKRNGQVFYFSSPAEASRKFGCREDDIREPLRDSKYNRQDIQIGEIPISELLNYHNCSSLNEYYHRILIHPK